MIRYLFFIVLAFCLQFNTFAQSYFNVKTYGAVGDGQILDSPSINKAIEAAASAGGGTVWFPAGTYLSYSIRLKSNITLYFDQGAVLLAATPNDSTGYDFPEPNIWGDSLAYQDFGHSHWHNSLIWGENLENISIIGSGMIYGKGLTRNGGVRRPQVRPGDSPPRLEARRDSMRRSGGNQGQRPAFITKGQGNKAISLKLCRNVIIRDISMLSCGHFAVLATGVDNLTIDNVKVDSNRDGFDIDCCSHVRISNCQVNTPNDDAIVLKTSYALGKKRNTENVTITNCEVSGFDEGTMLNGTYGRTQKQAPDRDGVTGRIKLGTESNGDFKNITVSNCVFELCRGLAIESVDGSVIEDVSISNITMRDIVNSPLFIRLGNRARGPEGTKAGAIRRVNIDNLVASGASSEFASIISGIPGYSVEDVRISNLFLNYKGGGTKEDAALTPPEKETGYPEPSMFGKIPSYGLFVRHAQNVEFNNIQISFTSLEQRSPVFLDDVKDILFNNFRAQRSNEIPVFVLKNVSSFSVINSRDIRDKEIKQTNYSVIK